MITLLGLVAVAANEWFGRTRRKGKAGRASFLVVAAGIAIYEWALFRFDWLPFLYYPCIWLKRSVGTVFQ